MAKILDPHSDCQSFFIKPVVRHCSKPSSMQFKRKLMKQTRENDKKPFFFLNLKFKNFKFFFVGFTSTRG